jgi:SAM-dependent methyltransferase
MGLDWSAVHSAERVLRPKASVALEAWRTLVLADNEQVESLPRRPRPEDFYAPVAETFRADPRRTDDPVLEHLRGLARPEETWLDLGAGGGRYSLALALHVRRLYAVEPSEGMRAVLAESMAEHRIENVEVFPERWPGPTAAPVADVAFMSHVSYDIAHIGPLLSQFESHGRHLCLVVLFERAPIADFAPLWWPVHGEPRSLLPGLKEFVTLLLALRRIPEVRLFSAPPRRFADIETLHRAARRPLWVLEGSEEDARLEKAVRELAVQVEDGVALSPQPRALGVVSWRPEGGFRLGDE